MRISVALATYEGEAWLPRQLSSLAEQSRRPDELIAFDDASSDATVKILRKFAARAPFPVRVQLQSARVGAAGNFQSAIAAADGDVISLCDQDDVWHPDKLQRIEAAFAANPSLDMVFSDADIVDEYLRPLGYSLWQSIGFGRGEQSFARDHGLLQVLARFNVVTGAGLAFLSRRRGLILPIPQGWIHDAWIAIILSGVGRYRWMNEPLFAYRQHSRQEIGAGPRVLSRQIEIARRMDGAYFDRLVRNFTACKERVASSTVASSQALQLIQRKIDHCIARRDMRLARSGKAPRLLRELFTGRYFSSSLGMRSVLQDLLLT
ncbi:MAG: glycosyltransferase family 2 protein [Planctomycetota bacterium]|nr:glycosyltransferase family 2 protein [Planctomycetota bacterium]